MDVLPLRAYTETELIIDTVMEWSYKLSYEYFGTRAYQGVRNVSFSENFAYVVHAIWGLRLGLRSKLTGSRLKVA